MNIQINLCLNLFILSEHNNLKSLITIDHCTIFTFCLSFPNVILPKQDRKSALPPSGAKEPIKYAVKKKKKRHKLEIDVEADTDEPPAEAKPKSSNAQAKQGSNKSIFDHVRFNFLFFFFFFIKLFV